VATEVWLTEKYYEEFHERKDNVFSDDQAIEVYKDTQTLRANWPQCVHQPPPEVGTRSGLYYVKFKWPTCQLRICFGARRENGVDKIIALTCRTKQELSKGNSNGDREWYRHIDTHGVDLWDSYRRGLLKSWKIYP
jgi:hypothetical protein